MKFLVVAVEDESAEACAEELESWLGEFYGEDAKLVTAGLAFVRTGPPNVAREGEVPCGS